MVSNSNTQNRHTGMMLVKRRCVPVLAPPPAGGGASRQQQEQKLEGEERKHKRWLPEGCVRVNACCACRGGSTAALLPGWLVGRQALSGMTGSGSAPCRRRGRRRHPRHTATAAAPKPHRWSRGVSTATTPGEVHTGRHGSSCSGRQTCAMHACRQAGGRHRWQPINA